MSRTLTVEGMSCEHCEETVEEALAGVAGVEDATADREAQQATVDGDADPDALVAAVEDAGYEASACRRANRPTVRIGRRRLRFRATTRRRRRS